jgi:hypothetical protein
VISANTGCGVWIYGSGTSGNIVAGNLIGHEKGTLLILTSWARRDNVASCREQPDPPKQG